VEPGAGARNLTFKIVPATVQVEAEKVMEMMLQTQLSRRYHEFYGSSNLIAYFHINEFRRKHDVQSITCQVTSGYGQSFYGLINCRCPDSLHLGAFIFPDDSGNGPSHGGSARGA
jgi:hypothetical protein